MMYFYITIMVVLTIVGYLTGRDHGKELGSKDMNYRWEHEMVKRGLGEFVKGGDAEWPYPHCFYRWKAFEVVYPEKSEGQSPLFELKKIEIKPRTAVVLDMLSKEATDYSCQADLGNLGSSACSTSCPTTGGVPILPLIIYMLGCGISVDYRVRLADICAEAYLEMREATDEEVNSMWEEIKNRAPKEDIQIEQYKVK
jgi:hypothetical protein